jgi:HKD family nuclease
MPEDWRNEEYRMKYSQIFSDDIIQQIEHDFEA